MDVKNELAKKAALNSGNIVSQLHINSYYINFK